MKDSELSALISLLDDTDDQIFGHVRDKLLSLGEPVIPHLESFWETTYSTLSQKRIEELIHVIQFESLLQQLSDWALNDSNNIFKGACLVAKYQYPDLEEEKIRKIIEQIKKDAWLEINASQTALEKVKVLNHVLFSIHGFTGNSANYNAPQNNFINVVLESRKGNALTLSLVYLITSQALGLTIEGVNLPEHFVLAYKDDSPLTRLFNPGAHDNILFYINPYNKGSIFSRREIDVFLKQLKLEPQDSYYRTCSNIKMVIRLLNNLVLSYEESENSQKADEIRKMLSILHKIDKDSL